MAQHGLWKDCGGRICLVFHLPPWPGLGRLQPSLGVGAQPGLKGNMGDPWLGWITLPPDLTPICDIHTNETPFPFFIQVTVPQQQQKKPNQTTQITMYLQPDMNQ